MTIKKQSGFFKFSKVFLWLKSKIIISRQSLVFYREKNQKYLPKPICS